MVKENVLFYLPTVKKVKKKKHLLKSSGIGYFKLSSLAVDMVNNPVMIYENGKRIGVSNLRTAKEHAKRNGLEFGSNDLEQEANRNRTNQDKEYTERISSKVAEDFIRLQKMKRQ